MIPIILFFAINIITGDVEKVTDTSTGHGI